MVLMLRRKKEGQPNSKAGQNGAKLGFEEKLWAAADKLRGHMDAADYKHVVLGLIFPEYISDRFLEQYEALKAEVLADPEGWDERVGDDVLYGGQ